jgi:hypothetical protein
MLLLGRGVMDLIRQIAILIMLIYSVLIKTIDLYQVLIIQIKTCERVEQDFAKFVITCENGLVLSG